MASNLSPWLRQKGAPDAATDLGPRVYSVLEIVSALRSELERTYPSVWVAGEIGDLKIHTSGHAYFTLKDAAAQLRCVMWRDSVGRAKDALANGREVVARGKLTVYDKSGQLQMSVQSLELRGAGKIEEAFRRLAEKLRLEGLTDPGKKRPIPPFPERVGVVTSKSGAALRDIVRTALRRDPCANIVICASVVQGDDAPASIVSAIEALNRFGHVDVIVVARGGGSREDLVAFDHEQVARAIVASEVPVITGVGHETDTTIADLVADRRASTPTAAAEAVFVCRDDVVERMRALQSSLKRASVARVRACESRLTKLQIRLSARDPKRIVWDRSQEVDELLTRLFAAGRARIRRAKARMDDLVHRLRGCEPKTRVMAFRERLVALENRQHRAIARSLAERRERLLPIEARLGALNPTAVLSRGFALVYDDKRRLVRHASHVHDGDRLCVVVSQGEFSARVDGTPKAQTSKGNGDEA